MADDVIASYDGELNDSQRGMLGRLLNRAKGALGDDPTQWQIHEQMGMDVRGVLTDLGVDPRESQTILFALLAGTNIATENMVDWLRRSDADPDLVERMDFAGSTICTAMLFAAGVEFGKIDKPEDIAGWLEERERIAHAAEALEEIEVTDEREEQDRMD